MNYTLKISTPSDTEIVMTRSFNAPRELVFDAHFKPELLKQWMGVVMGFQWDVCEIDLRVGGTYRYVWSRDGFQMGMSGEYREVEIPKHVAATEVFDQAWYEGNGFNMLDFTEIAGVTTVTMTVRYDSKVIRDKVLESPMDKGVAAGYDLLEKVLANVLTVDNA